MIFHFKDRKMIVKIAGYDVLEEAYKAYCEASKKYHGEYGSIA